MESPPYLLVVGQEMLAEEKKWGIEVKACRAAMALERGGRLITLAFAAQGLTVGASYPHTSTMLKRLPRQKMPLALPY